MTEAIAVRNEMPVMDLGKVLATSGYFQDAKSISQAVVKVLAGRELGLPPVASMSGINIIQGRPALSANVMAALIKRSGRYDYRVKEMNEKVCAIEFFEKVDGKRESIGVSAFTLEEAKKAGTKNLDKFPRNMLFARAMSNGFRWYTPDLSGGPVYTPEEMGAEVDEDGNTVLAPVVTPPPSQPVVDAVPEPVAGVTDDGVDIFPEEPPAPKLTEKEELIAIITELGEKLKKDQAHVHDAIHFRDGQDNELLYLRGLKDKWRKKYASQVNTESQPAMV